MYKLGHRVYLGWRHKKAVYICILLAAVIVGAIMWYLRTQNQTVVINPTTPLTTNVKAAASTTRTFSETDFAVTLPNSWVQTDHQTTPYNMYVFKNTTKYMDARYMDIYIDTIPTDYAVNKLLPITITDNRLDYGALSDVCSNFTGPVSPNPNQPIASTSEKSKWQGISFICDLNNPDRNVVGTSSSAGINEFDMTGPKTGKHSFFFVYTDHTSAPEYQTLMDALNSLQVK